ncbi:hypothetical protein O988_00429 [Pseudogymnoascus sp. VKM F-3808]|nr:hypothetical protein O988_00429 [Pseudogymnoascus sp. VKM F-3808]
MSLPRQLKGVDLSGSRTTRESSPRSTLGLNQDQERSPTSDLNPHLEEESVNGNTLDLSEAAVRWIRSAQTITNSGYTIQDLMVRFLQSSGTLPFLLPTDKLRASEFEISELRKKNEALKTILHKGRSSDGNGGTEGGDMAGSDIHIGVAQATSNNAAVYGHVKF